MFRVWFLVRGYFGFGFGLVDVEVGSGGFGRSVCSLGGLDVGSYICYGG